METIKPLNSKFIDLTGKIFCRLTVLSFNCRTDENRFMWNCLCECGNRTIVEGSHLRGQHTTSCGCYRDQRIVESRTTHGRSRLGKVTKEYHTWLHICQRCENPNDNGYYKYGARGITMCKRWRDSFENFLSDMGQAPSKDHSIERKNNDGNYEPDNCKWATILEQANNRRTNRRVEYLGQVKTLAQWARDTGLRAGVIGARLRKGWNVHDSLTKPVKKLDVL